MNSRATSLATPVAVIMLLLAAVSQLEVLIAWKMQLTGCEYGNAKLNNTDMRHTTILT